MKFIHDWEDNKNHRVCELMACYVRRIVSDIKSNNIELDVVAGVYKIDRNLTGYIDREEYGINIWHPIRQDMSFINMHFSSMEAAKQFVDDHIEKLGYKTLPQHMLVLL